ncbi:MAG: OprO/OprP family phosphate-selective porin [Gemmataceae bacterium]
MFSTWKKVLLASSLLAVLPAGAQAQNPPASQKDLERRVQELEAIVRQLQVERQAPPGKPASPTAEPKPPEGVIEVLDELPPEQSLPAPSDVAIDAADRLVTLQAPGAPGSPGIAPDRFGADSIAGWSNGFFIQSPDRKYRLRITGQLQPDYRAYFISNNTQIVDEFVVRRARLGIEAIVYEFFEFRLLPDFGQNQPRITDAYVNARPWDQGQFAFGKFKQPFSYEQLIQDRFYPLMERSLIDQLVPARDVGVMLHGREAFAGRFEYGFSAFNGQRDGNGDSNDREDVAGRVAFRPFNSDDFPVLRTLMFGMGVTTGIEQEPMLPAGLITPSGITWLQFNNGVVANGLRNRYSPELAYFYGPLGIVAQVFWMDQEIQAPRTPGGVQPGRVTVPFDGFFILSSLLLTGETRTSYAGALQPLRPFDPQRPFHGGYGAWELVGRVSRLSVASNAFQPGANQLVDPTLWSSGATEMTLGINWYLNSLVRLQLNYEHAWYDDPVRFGVSPGSIHRSSNALMTRFQVIF